MNVEGLDSTTDIRSLREASKGGSVMIVKLIGLNETSPKGIDVLREISREENGNIRFTSNPFTCSDDERVTNGVMPVYGRNGAITLDEAIRNPVVYIRIEGREVMMDFVNKVLAKAAEYNLSYGKVIIS